MTKSKIIYHRGSYNKFNDTEQWTRISDGCPNNCGFCYCPTDFQFYGIPEIVRNKVKIMDMNLLVQPKGLETIKKLGSIKVNNKVVSYELICGIDWRFMTDEIATELKKNRFKNIRMAWDGGIVQQYKIKKAINKLIKAGYRSTTISIFMVCNWRISYDDCLKKLDLCKVWNVKVNDCWWDNQTSPNIKPIYWNKEQIKNFRRKSRKHNQLVLFGIDPEIKQDKLL